MSLKSIQTELIKVDKKKKRLENRLKVQKEKLLNQLPEKAGVTTIDDLIVSLLPLASPQFRRQLQHEKSIATAAHVESSHKRRSALSQENDRRHRFSVDVKRLVKADMEAGKKTMLEIARDHGPSLPTLRLWKRNWRLTKPIKK